MPASQKKLMAIFGIALLLQALVTLLAYGNEVRQGAAFGGDFAVFWQAAEKLASGNSAALYDTKALRQVLDAKAPAGSQVAPFVYPPPMALLIWPLGYSSYNIAVAIWTLLPLVAFYWLLRKILIYSEKEAAEHFRLAALFTLPFVMVNMMSGQTGMILACLFMAGIYGWQRKRWWTGIAFGAMIIKPQLGVLLPFMLVATRQWRIMAFAAGTVAVLLALSTLFLGAGIWKDYATILPLFGRFAHERFGPFASLVASPYMSLHLMGAPLFIAAWVQATISLFVLLIIMHLFGETQHGSPCLRFSLLGCAALLATPHAMVYDTPLLALGAATLFLIAWRKGWAGGFEMGAFIALLLMPYLQPLLMQFGLSISWLVLLVFFIALLRRYRMEFQPIT